MLDKILAGDTIIAILRVLRRSNKIIVLAHGCFDWLHYGHLLHLQEAKNLGDILIVSITTDQFVDKGLGRPIFNQRQRAEMVAALECVDFVVFSDSPDAVQNINLIRPLFYVKGRDYQSENDPILHVEMQAVENHSGALFYTAAPLWHTSELLRRYDSFFQTPSSNPLI